MKSTDLRPGLAIKLDGQLYVITQYTHVTPGNLRAFVQVKLKRISDGTIIEKRLRSGEEVEQVDLDRREVEYLYQENTGSGESYVFMDMQDYDQFSLPAEMVKDQMPFLKPNTVVQALVAEGKPLLIELPLQVELVVEDTPPGIKGATATNQLKEATMETGLKVKVPPFIEPGETIRISTSDGSYLSRAKE